VTNDEPSAVVRPMAMRGGHVRVESERPGTPPPASMPDEQPNLLRAIAARARRASDGALASCGLAGLVALGGLAWMDGRGWGVLLPVVALGMWGGWGVVDRTLHDRAVLRADGAATTGADQALVAARFVLALLGVATGVVAMLALLGTLLGKIIS
jgi:hypothetical protein